MLRLTSSSTTRATRTVAVWTVSVVVILTEARLSQSDGEEDAGAHCHEEGNFLNHCFFFLRFSIFRFLLVLLWLLLFQLSTGCSMVKSKPFLGESFIPLNSGLVVLVCSMFPSVSE